MRPAEGGLIGSLTEYVMYEHKLVQMSRLEPMTKLLNRSHLEQLLAEEMSRSERCGKPPSVLMIDIGFFNWSGLHPEALAPAEAFLRPAAAEVLTGQSYLTIMVSRRGGKHGKRFCK